MTVRQKITILITMTGFLSSLLFSGVVFWEMLEQPYRIMDAELASEALFAVRAMFDDQGAQEKDGTQSANTGSMATRQRYWLRIYDSRADQPVYQSQTAQWIRIPEPEPGASASVRVVVPPEAELPGYETGDKVPFRVRCFSVSANAGEIRVCVGLPMEKLDEEIRETVNGVIAGLVFSVLLLLCTSYFVAGLILRPVRVMNDQARDITEKRLHRRIPMRSGQDEFCELAGTLNKVFDRLQYAFTRQEQLLADASHELKTPLTLMRVTLDQLSSGQQEKASGLPPQDLARLTHQVLQMDRLVKNLLDLSSLEIRGGTRSERVDVSALLNTLIDDYRLLADIRGISIVADLPEGMVMPGDKVKMHRAFSNILDNAIKYNVAGGRVEVAGHRSAFQLRIGVNNTGPGVPEVALPRVFEPFYRVEQSRSSKFGGSGLGLAIVKRIVELHGGHVTLESEEGNWTRVEVSLPLPGNPGPT